VLRNLRQLPSRDDGESYARWGVSPGFGHWLLNRAQRGDARGKLAPVNREGQLQDWLARERGHLAAGQEPHFHVVVWTDNENEWEIVRFLSSPPYRERNLAERDANDPSLLARTGSFNVDVVACDRACPRSGLGEFGYSNEEHGVRPWWKHGGGWKSHVDPDASPY